MELIESDLIHEKEERGEIMEETADETTRLNGMTDGSLEFENNKKFSGTYEKSPKTQIYESFSESGSQLPKQFSMSLIRTMQPAGSDFALFKNVLHLLVICLSDLTAGTIQFSDVIGINRQPSFKEFMLFLQTIEVYGAGYTDDVDYFRYNKRNTETHTDEMIKQLERVVQCYDLAITALDAQRDSMLD